MKLFCSTHVLWISFIFISSHVSAQNLKQVSTAPRPSEILKNDRTNSIVIPEFGLKLHLFADRSSDVLRKLNFGEKVRFDENSLEAPNPDWIPVVLQDGLSGFLLRKHLIFAPKNKFLQTLVFESEKKLNSKSVDYKQKMEITDILFSYSVAGEFTGDDFIYLRAKAGFALKKTLEQINELNLKPDDNEELLSFLKRHQTKLLFDYGSGKYYLDSNYFWKLIESYPKTKYSDYAGFLAIESLPVFECKSDLKCRLEELRKGKMRYIYLFPTGNYVKIYLKDILNTFNSITKDQESIACYPPVPDSIKSEINMMFRYVSEYGSNERKKILPHLQILKTECLK